MRQLLNIFGYDTSNIDDLVLFVHSLGKWLFVITHIVIAVYLIYVLSNGGLPPEPQWWLEFEKLIGITW